VGTSVKVHVDRLAALGVTNIKPYLQALPIASPCDLHIDGRLWCYVAVDTGYSFGCYQFTTNAPLFSPLFSQPIAWVASGIRAKGHDGAYIAPLSRGASVLHHAWDWAAPMIKARLSDKHPSKSPIESRTDR
jgi:hypothetical protein